MPYVEKSASKKFVPPPQTAMIVHEGVVMGTVSLCGEILRMPCDKKVQHFEMHGYFGPTPCNKDGMHSIRNAKDFWDKFHMWEEQGMLVNGNVCEIHQSSE